MTNPPDTAPMRLVDPRATGFGDYPETHAAQVPTWRTALLALAAIVGALVGLAGLSGLSGM